MRDDVQAVFAPRVSIGHGDDRSILHVSCPGVGRRTGEVILPKKVWPFTWALKKQRRVNDSRNGCRWHAKCAFDTLLGPALHIDCATHQVHYHGNLLGKNLNSRNFTRLLLVSTTAYQNNFFTNDFFVSQAFRKYQTRKKFRRNEFRLSSLPTGSVAPSRRRLAKIATVYTCKSSYSWERRERERERERERREREREKVRQRELEAERVRKREKERERERERGREGGRELEWERKRKTAAEKILVDQQLGENQVMCCGKSM